MSGKTVAYLLGGGCATIALAALVVLFAFGGAAWLWLEGTGTNRRAAAAGDIARALEVTIEQAERVGEISPDGRRQSKLTCRLRIRNLGDKDIAAFGGTILFTDEQGWTVFSCGVGDGWQVRANDTLVEPHVLECFGHRPSSGRIEDVDVGRLTATWLANSVTFADGTRIEVLPEVDASH